MPTPNNQQNPAVIQRILAAAQFAAEKHAQQRRKGAAQEPYINHLIEVARLIADSSDQLDPELIMAGLLHDTVEDTGVTKEEIAHKFGPDVASLVAEVTDDKTLPKETRKALQVKNAPKKSLRGQTLKLADKISNVRDVGSSPPEGWPLERRREYFDWAKRVVDGLRGVSPRLEAAFDEAYAKRP